MSFPLALVAALAAPRPFLAPYDPEPVKNPRDPCSSCRHHHEALRSPPSPCRWCSLETADGWEPRPRIPRIRLGDRVRGRDCLGAPFAGRVDAFHSRDCVVIGDRITPAALIDEVIP